MAFSLLRRCMNANDATQIQQQIKTSTELAKLFCPICSNQFRNIRFYGHTKLDLEACTICQFIWFDTNEYDGLYDPQSEIQSQPHPSPEQVAIARTRMFEVEQVIEEKARDGVYERDQYSEMIGLTGLPVETGALIKGHTWITWILCTLVLIVGAWSVHHSEISAQYFGMIPSQALRYVGATFVTAFFIHTSWLHLFINLYFLLLFADNIEDALGYKRLLVILGCSTAFGFILQAFIQSDPDIPIVGASGGISGLLVFYTLNFPKARLSFFYFSFVARLSGWLVFTPKAFFLGWVFLQIYMLSHVNEYTNIAIYTHLGGTIAGLFFWLAWGNFESDKHENDFRPKMIID